MIKKLAKSIREYKKASILTPFYVSLEVIMECLIPLIMVELINGIYESSIGRVLFYGFILILIAVLALAFGTLSGIYAAKASAGYAKNLRKDLFEQVQKFSFSNIDKFSSSSLVTRLTTDVSNVQNAYMMIIRVAVRSPLMLIFSFTMAFLINPELSLIFVVVLPLLGFGLFMIIKSVFPIFARGFKKYDKLNNSVQENIKGMRVVKSFVREDFEIEKFAKATADVKAEFSKAEKIIALNGPLMQFCIYAVILLVSYFGAYKIITTFGGITADGIYLWGELSTGQLSSLITYSTQMLLSLMFLSMVLVMITMSQASAKRICEVLDEKSSITNPENPVTQVADGSIDFENVDFRYSASANVPALKGINLHINSGQTVGIIGGTGSGKTTLVQLISRLYDSDGGSVKVGGIDVRQYDVAALREAVSVVLQKNVLFSGTIKENLRWGNKEATDEEMIEACKTAQAHDFIMSFPKGYDTFIEQGGTNVSGGQKQRLCIARALLKKPKILILDDNTSAVDTRIDSLIRKAFKNNLPGVTKLIIAQRTASIQDADKIIVMDNGAISAEGTHQELLAGNEIYREVYYSQNKAGEKNGNE